MPGGQIKGIPPGGAATPDRGLKKGLIGAREGAPEEVGKRSREEQGEREGPRRGDQPGRGMTPYIIV
ncbi:hypothetical protein C1I59_00640 [Paenibacillus polymyxa]|nr:hypothetical protein C1I59_00640 [Paenibacillus polymyxa]